MEEIATASSFLSNRGMDLWSGSPQGIVEQSLNSSFISTGFLGNTSNQFSGTAEISNIDLSSSIFDSDSLLSNPLTQSFTLLNSSSARLLSEFSDPITGQSESNKSLNTYVANTFSDDILTNYQDAEPNRVANETTQINGEQASRAFDFVNSLGVNVHLAYTDTPYGNYYGIVKPKLQELGVQHIRDGAYQSPDFLNRIKDLGSVGIKTNLIFAGNPETQILSTVRTLGSAIEAVEGPNESDLGKKFPYNGQVFPQSTHTYQKQLYNTIKGNPDTRHLTVVLPSLGSAKNSPQLGYLEDGDVGNMHSYPNLGNPSTDGLDWWFIPHAQTVAGNTKPLWSTETGYQTLVGSALGVSETAAGKYIPRLWLEQFNRGIQRIYTYELIDQKPADNLDPEEHYGLLRNDGSPKPAFNTLKNAIALLKEPNTNFTPGKLNYTLAGDTTNLHHTLLQKSNGEFNLILWQETKSWDNNNKVDINVPSRKVTLNLNTKFERAEAYKPFYSTTLVGQYANPQQVQLDIGDDPLILQLKP